MARLQLDVRYSGARAAQTYPVLSVERSERFNVTANFFAPGWPVAEAKWVRRALTKAVSARFLRCLSIFQGNADASGGNVPSHQ